LETKYVPLPHPCLVKRPTEDFVRTVEVCGHRIVGTNFVGLYLTDTACRKSFSASARHGENIIKGKVLVREGKRFFFSDAYFEELPLF
jgi:hypothetical protein